MTNCRVPDELRVIAQWTHSFNADEIKRPAYTEYAPGGALTYEQAVARANGLSVGFYATKEDPYILGDIDHVDIANFTETVPKAILDLLISNPTYCEVSPSGKGIRFIYKFADTQVKKRLSGSYYHVKSEHHSVKKESQINMGSPWQRITGNEFEALSTGRISVISLDALKRVYNVTEAVSSLPSTVDLPKASLEEITANLMRIPLTQSPRAKRGFETIFHTEYTHYEFWMKVLMALHNYALLTGKTVECMTLACRWSATDPTDYTGESDVISHWQSFSNDRHEVVSYRTLFKLANMCSLRWPVPRALSKSESENYAIRKPLNSEVVNFTYMLKFYDVTIYEDVGNPEILYLTGDEDVMLKHIFPFCRDKIYDKYYGPFEHKTLTSAFLQWCQSLGFIGITRTVISSHLYVVCHQVQHYLDPVKEYFDIPFKDLPERYQENKEHYHRSTLDDLWDCITIDHMTNHREQEEELYKQYYKVWLLGLIRTLDYPNEPSINNCVLLFTGREQIRKTSHFRFLLPKFMRERYISFTTHGFATETSMRDIAKISATSRVLIWDEIEQFLNAETESNFKKVIDNTPQTVIDKYRVVPVTFKPVSIYGATSNLREFKLGNEGSRRLFHIPVKWVDTDAMDNICWHKLINDLRTEAKVARRQGKIPWLLDESELMFQRHLHSKIRSKNNIDIMMEEVFDFEDHLETQHGVLPGIGSVQTDRTNRLLNTKEVITLLGRLGYSVHTISRAAVIKSLERLCGAYTGSSTKSVNMIQPKGVLYRGEFIQGKKKKWVLPPMVDGADGGQFKDCM